MLNRVSLSILSPTFIVNTCRLQLAMGSIHHRNNPVHPRGGTSLVVVAVASIRIPMPHNSCSYSMSAGIAGLPVLPPVLSVGKSLLFSFCDYKDNSFAMILSLS